MIPRIIHYCWFGSKPKPKKVLDYIETWKKYLPDFEIKEWNESNFDVNMLEYTKEAYFAKKYAFVSDVARLYALINEGGIYFDTDIRLARRFSDELLTSHGFLGFEHDVLVTTGVMASEAYNPILESFYDEYKKRRFFIGIRYDESTNVSHLTELMIRNGLVPNNQKQLIGDFIVLPQVYLCANDWITKTFYNTKETYAIHEFSYTWGDKSKIKKHLKQVYTIFLYMVNLILNKLWEL